MEHGRSKPTCDFWCEIGRHAAKVAVSYLLVGDALSDLSGLARIAKGAYTSATGASLGSAADHVLKYIHNPLGDETYAIQPYSGIGRAALYGVSPLIFGYGARRLHSLLLEHVENVTGEDHKRRLRTNGDFKSVQVDWTNDAVFFPAHINSGKDMAKFAREQAPIEYEIGRKALFRVRCVPAFVADEGVPDARTCDAHPSDWYSGYTGVLVDKKDRVTDERAHCYKHSLKIVSSPGRHGKKHFLSRFQEPLSPPLPPPSSPPPTPPDVPNPSPPPLPPLGFTADEMRDKIKQVQAKFCGE